jgi:hypothetical protein
MQNKIIILIYIFSHKSGILSKIIFLENIEFQKYDYNKQFQQIALYLNIKIFLTLRPFLSPLSSFNHLLFVSEVIFIRIIIPALSPTIVYFGLFHLICVFTIRNY